MPIGWVDLVDGALGGEDAGVVEHRIQPAPLRRELRNRLFYLA